MAKVAFLGLGTMGYPMAGHLAKAGHEVTVLNRTAAKAEGWAREHKGLVAGSPREAAQGAQFVLACVGADPDVRAVTLEPGGAFETMDKGAVFVDHTTASAGLARELAAAAAARGFEFLDAPVSGGQAGAEKGALTIMVGGAAEAFAKAAPIFSAYARAVKHLGPAGAGQLAKMVNQICIAGIVQGLAEAVQFAEAAGLDPAAVFETISKGAAQSWQMENRVPTMIARKFDFGFAVDWMRKDLAMCLAEARANGARLPLTALVDQFYADVQDAGGGRWDTSSLVTRFDS
jgi:3-hydroxyisobutyrate dehydrogenase